MLLSARCVAEYSELIRASRIILGRYERSTDRPLNEDERPSMSATDSDARRMLVNALEHRLCKYEGRSFEI